MLNLSSWIAKRTPAVKSKSPLTDQALIILTLKYLDSRIREVPELRELVEYLCSEKAEEIARLRLEYKIKRIREKNHSDIAN